MLVSGGCQAKNLFAKLLEMVMMMIFKASPFEGLSKAWQPARLAVMPAPSVASAGAESDSENGGWE